VSGAQTHRKEELGAEQGKEEQEIAVVAKTYTHPKPRTVMVESFDTKITYSAVHSPGRSVYTASVAIPETH